jgi:hypothetical protein
MARESAGRFDRETLTHLAVGEGLRSRRVGAKPVKAGSSGDTVDVANVDRVEAGASTLCPVSGRRWPLQRSDRRGAE